MNELVSQDWYQSLVEECKSIITEATFTSRWSLVEGYWLLGQRIRTDNIAQEFAKGNKSFVQGLAQNLDISERTLYYAIAFFDKYPQLDTVPDGKNISWNKLITKYLPKSKEAIIEELKINPVEYGENIYFPSAELIESRWDDHIIEDETKFPTITRLSRFFKNGKEFSLRDYARVQEFPDDFKFVGNYSSIKSQIGNAVSPTMAKFMGQKLTGTTFIDLFAGCGGLSCGLESLGKKAVLAVEFEKSYFQTYTTNYPDVPYFLGDIRYVTDEMLPDADIIVGGPPCQGFSLAGNRFKDDPRNELYKEFVRIVDIVGPREFLLENVPQIAEIKEQVIKDFEEIGYTVETYLVKGEEIGMKQTRHRFFFLGKLNG